MSKGLDFKKIVRNFETQFNAHEVASLANYFSESVSISRGDGESHTGLSLIVSFLESFITQYTQARVSVMRMQTMDRSSVLIEWVFSGTEKGTSRAVNASFAALLTFNISNMVENIEIRGDTALLKSDYPLVESAEPDPEKIRQMTENYKNAWCSRDPGQVASFYAEDGFIIINGGPPWAGRAGLAAMSGGFIEAYPDAVLTTDDLHIESDRAVWSWTFSGTNTGPGGNGEKAVFSGYEVWRINENYQIAESYGYYDSAI